MAIIVQDTFTEAVDTLLSAHTPDTGTGWTIEENTTVGKDFNVIAADDELGTSGGAENGVRIIATSQPDPSINTYDVEADEVVMASSGDDPHVYIARFQDTSNYYAAPNRGSAGSNRTARIVKKVGGVLTELASRTDVTRAPGDTWRFEIRGLKKTYQNDVEQLSTADADAALVSAGKAGLAVGNVYLGGGDITTQRFDNYVLTEQVVETTEANNGLYRHVGRLRRVRRAVSILLGFVKILCQI